MFNKKKRHIETQPEPVDTRDYIGDWGKKDILLSSYGALFNFTEKYAFREKSWKICANVIAVLTVGILALLIWLFIPTSWVYDCIYLLVIFLGVILWQADKYLLSLVPLIFCKFEGHTHAETKTVLKQLEALLEEAGTLSTIVHNAENQGDTHLVDSAKHSLLKVRAELNRVAKPYVLEYEAKQRRASQTELDDLARSVGLK